jgi:mono/diheme cytochrome c family protein
MKRVLSVALFFGFVGSMILVLGFTRAEAEKGAAGHSHGKVKDAHGMKMKDDRGNKKMDHGKKEKARAADKTDAPIYTTMEALHANGGTPPGWRFRIPAGDPQEGRKVFAKMECYSCHNIDGEKFPKRDDDPAKVGPDLTGMGAMHGDEAYFFESIVNPNRVILKGPGYIKDGKSIMPSYNDVIGLQEAVDLVAYIKGLKGGHKMEGTKGHSNMKGVKKDTGHGSMKKMKH